MPHNRTEKACGIIQTSDVQPYVPLLWVVKYSVAETRQRNFLLELYDGIKVQNETFLIINIRQN